MIVTDCNCDHSRLNENMEGQKDFWSLTATPAQPTQPSPAVAGTSRTPGMDSSVISQMQTTRIADLNDKIQNPNIKARVMNKSDIRKFKNGNGQKFNMSLCDGSGDSIEICAVVFYDLCDVFYDSIQPDRVYFMSGFNLKKANKNYNYQDHDYEIVFTLNTEVTECMDDESSMPTNNYNYVPINEIANKNLNTFLAVIGVCIMADKVNDLTSKRDGAIKKKREVTLVDSSGSAIKLALWGNDAENETFDRWSNPIISAKIVKLREFNGSKYLECIENVSKLQVNPDLQEARALRDWYDNQSAAAVHSDNSDRLVNYAVVSTSEWITFSEAEARQLGSSEKKDYYSLLGVLRCVIAENALYKACPQANCNKKLTNENNGMYRCEKCKKEYPDFKYLLRIEANVSDPTGDQRITAFNEAAEALLGHSAADVGRMFEHNKAAYTQVFEEAKFNSFVFKFQTNMETYKYKHRGAVKGYAVGEINHRVARRAGLGGWAGGPSDARRGTAARRDSSRRRPPPARPANKTQITEKHLLAITLNFEHSTT